MAFGEAAGYGAAPDEGEGMAAETEAPVYDDDESAALAEAFPEMGGSPERMAAFKAAVAMCVDRILAERDSGPVSEPAPAKGGKAKAADALILAFGGPKKKD